MRRSGGRARQPGRKENGRAYALTLTKAALLVRERRVSAVKLVDRALTRIERLDGTLEAWVVILPSGVSAKMKASRPKA